jgi:hypothetical protein
MEGSMSVTFQAPEWGTVEIPIPTTEDEHSALQVIIEAAEDCDAPNGANLPEDSPMRAALKDLGYALAAHRRGTTPDMARLQELVSDAMSEVVDYLEDAGHHLVKHVGKMNLAQLYEEGLTGPVHYHDDIAEKREKFRKAVARLEKLMDKADETLAPEVA